MSNEESQRCLWVGLQCKNPACRRDFPFETPSGPMTAKTSIEEGKAGATDSCSQLAGRLAAFFDASKAFSGPETLPSEGSHTTALLQKCPHCGRFYNYTYPDFFFTSEDLPEQRPV